MLATRSLLVVSVLSLGGLGAACSSSSSGTTATTGATTTTTTTTTAAGGGGGAGTGGSGGSETGGAGGGVTPACGTFAGPYAGKGTCDNAAYFFPSAACVKQDACALDVFITGGKEFKGAIAGGEFDVATSTGVTIDCTGTIGADANGTMKCAGAGVTCEGTIAPAKLKAGTASLCCDVAKQDCGAGLRCQAVGSDGTALFGACIAEGGAVEVGSPCQRASEDALDVGYDDCKKGGFCTKAGTTDGVRVCRELCALDSACGAGAGCFDMRTVPNAGICMPLCTMWAAPADAGGCAAGSTCRIAVSIGDTGTRYNLRCDTAGAKAAGDTCASFQECGEGLGCFKGTCAPYCDSGHTCPDGLSCNVLPAPKADGVDPTLGSCE